MAQISRHVRRERILHSISEREAERKARIAQQDPQAFCTTAAGSRKRGRPRKDKLAFDFGDTDPLINMRFRDHHQMSDSEREYLDVTQWALKHKEDPAMKVSCSSSPATEVCSLRAIELCHGSEESSYHEARP